MELVSVAVIAIAGGQHTQQKVSQMFYIWDTLCVSKVSKCFINFQWIWMLYF